MRIIISPLRQLHETIAAHKPSHVITLTSPGTDAPVCASVPDARRLILTFNDIDSAREGLVPPHAEMIEEILSFGADWDRASPLLVHCLAGISRSTAAAYILACSFVPAGAEITMATKLRHASPTATPNALMVALADEILGREGRMIAGIQRIGRGLTAMEGEPFHMETS